MMTVDKFQCFGFLTNARRRPQSNTGYERLSDTHSLLSQLRSHEGGLSSSVSSVSKISSNMRDCTNSPVFSNGEIQLSPSLNTEDFREQLCQLFGDIEVAFSDSKAAQQCELDKRMTALKADTTASLAKLANEARALVSVINVSSRCYQQENKSGPVARNALTLFNKLTDTTRAMMKYSSATMTSIDEVTMAHAICSSSKAWLQYQLGDSSNSRCRLKGAQVLPFEIYFS